MALDGLRHMDLIQDIVLVEKDQQKLAAKYRDLLTPDRYRVLVDSLVKLRATLIAQAGALNLNLTKLPDDFIQAFYSNVLARVENAGHRFGENLPEQEKRALIAFLATL